MKIGKAVAILVAVLISYSVIALILTGEFCYCIGMIGGGCWCDIVGMRIPQAIWFGVVLSIPILIIGIWAALVFFYTKKQK